MAPNPLKDFLFDVYFPMIYKSACREDVVPGRVLFVEYRTGSMPDSFALILRALRERKDIDCRLIALDRNHSSYPEFVMKSRIMLSEMATAEVVFLSDINEVVSCVKKRKETKVVQLWHACGAFKKFGYSTIGNEHGTDRRWMERHPLYGNLDLVTVSAPAVIEPFAEAMNLKKRKEVVQSTGVSRTDIFFQKNMIHHAKDFFYHEFPGARGKKVIVFAPTFRGRTPDVTTALAFNPKKLISLLGDEYVLVMKHHPLVKNIPPLPDSPLLFDATNKVSIEKLLCVADMVITDYSSLIFEYSLFEKPMFFFAYDLEEYKKWNGFYEPYEKIVPGPVCRTHEELAQQILLADQNFDPSKIVRFREKYMASCDGHATERIIRKLFGH